MESYESKYAEECGRYSLDRITSVVEEYLKCSDYKHGNARVKCTNPEQIDRIMQYLSKKVRAPQGIVKSSTT